jgi:hypothetical protein
MSAQHRGASRCERVDPREKASGQTYDEIGENIFLLFNEAAPTEANLINRGKTSLTGSVLYVK